MWLEKGNGSRCTGKERDIETGLDYFGARYYSNGLGRFITPDWSAVPVPVPYADLSDPQSLNQYSYVRNIPTVKVDADGHDGCCTLSDLARLVDEGIAEGRAMIDALKPAAPLAPLAPAAGALAPAAVLAVPSVGAMILVATQPPMQNHPADDPPSAGNMMLDALNPSYQPAPPLPNTQPTTPPQPQAQQPQIDAAHKGGNKRTRDKHQAGTSRDKRARDEAHPSRKHYPPRKPPDGHKGPWPPKPKPPKKAAANISMTTRNS